MKHISRKHRAPDGAQTPTCVDKKTAYAFRTCRNRRILGLSAILALALPGCHRNNARVAAVTPVAPPVAPVVAVPTNPLATYKPSPRIFEFQRYAPKQVALTFDAGSDDSAVQAILAALKQHHTRSTFFLTGRFCEQYPDSCRAIGAAGMEIGNHSYSHPRFTKRKEAEIETQLARAEQAISKACGRGAKPLFRFPYGDENKRARHTVAQNGYQAIGWSLDSWDSVGKPKSADFVAKRILAKIKPGNIVLMHVSYPESAKALPRIFAYLDKQGIANVPVSELLLAPPPSAPKTRITQGPQTVRKGL